MKHNGGFYLYTFSLGFYMYEFYKVATKVEQETRRTNNKSVRGS